MILARQDGSTLDIDTWLMSCRVLQRGVEAVVRNALVAQAVARGCDTITGTYVPTDRNGMVSDHYARLGWHAAGTDGSTTRWVLPLNPAPPALSTHIAVEV